MNIQDAGARMDRALLVLHIHQGELYGLLPEGERCDGCPGAKR